MGKVIFIALSYWIFANAPIPYRQLSWSDYKGVPTNNHLASTCSGIVIEKDTAYAIFEPDRSWTRTSDPVVLRHEQLHFAITQWWAKGIAKALKRGENIGVGEQLRDWGRMQEWYDDQTDHGRNIEKQKEWEEKIKM